MSTHGTYGPGSQVPQPLADFFNQFEGFSYNSASSATDEFRRLCEFKGWSGDTRAKREAWRGFRDALIHQFNTSYGTDINDINGWHAMMAHLGVDPLPDTVAACKKIVKSLYVNLVDLVDARGVPSKQVELFSSERALSNYTRRTGKIFPRDAAKAGGVLKFLLRQIQKPRSRRH